MLDPAMIPMKIPNIMKTSFLVLDLQVADPMAMDDGDGKDKSGRMNVYSRFKLTRYALERRPWQETHQVESARVLLHLNCR